MKNIATNVSLQKIHVNAAKKQQKMMKMRLILMLFNNSKKLITLKQQ